MGWDGYACRVKFDDYHKENLLERLSDADAAHLGFTDSGGVANTTPSAGLWCRTGAQALAQATGEDPYNTEWWPDKVKELAQRAKWDFEVEAGAAVHKHSAQLFLDLCAKHHLGVRFD